MKRYLLAVVVVMASLSPAAAQPPVIPEPPKTVVQPRPHFPPARWMFTSTPGVYYYDSGEYLVGGTLGLSRAIGLWTMQPPANDGGSASFDPYGGASSAGPCVSRGRHFHFRR